MKVARQRDILDNLVGMKHDLARARWQVTPLQVSLLLTAISKLDYSAESQRHETDYTRRTFEGIEIEDKYTTYVTPDEFSQFTGDRKNAVRDLRSACKNIDQQSIEFFNTDGEKSAGIPICSFFADLPYEVEIVFHPTFYNLITNLKAQEGYTKFELKAAKGLSLNATRLMMLLRSRPPHKEWYIKLEQFIHAFTSSTKMRVKDFNSRILTPSIQELNKKGWKINAQQRQGARKKVLGYYVTYTAN